MKKKETVLKKIVDAAIDKERDGWPPVCTALFYQPERPVDPLRPEQAEERLDP